jgi:hypothetical protein
MLDVFVAEIVLQGARVLPIVRELVAAGVAQQVRIDFAVSVTAVLAGVIHELLYLAGGQVLPGCLRWGCSSSAGAGNAAVSAAPSITAAGSQGQCEQFNHADPNHQHDECYGIIVEPISSWAHDTPPLFPLISRAGRQTGSNVRWKW